jgi:hypothetical protein
MTVQTINIGNQVNDGLGDDLRTAFQKVNGNFAELNASLTVTASNIGTNGVGIFKQKTGVNLEFKNLVSGTKILLDETPDAIIINNTSPDSFTRVDTDSGSILASSYPQLTIQGTTAPGNVTGRKDIEVTAFGSQVRIKTLVPVTDYLESYDFGPITGDYLNAIQFALQSANIDFGTVDLPARINLDCGGIVI